MSDLDPGLELLEPARPTASAGRRPFLLGLLVGCGASLLLLLGGVLAGAVALTTLMATGHVPDTAAVPGDRLPTATRDFLLEAGLVEPDEQVLYFYSDGLISLREDGNLFTDRRVISYWEEDGELRSEQATYPEIADIVPAFEEGFLESSEVTVQRADGDSFVLLVSNDGGHDRRFVELLTETWELRR